MDNNSPNLKTTWQDIEQIAEKIKIPINLQAKLSQLISYAGQLLNLCDMTLLPASTDKAISKCSEIIANLKNDFNDDSINSAFDALHK